MKKVILTLALVAVYSGVALADFPTGKFAGQGAWKDDKGGSGTYTVQTTSSADGLDNTYVYDGSNAVSFKMAVENNKNGFFDVQVAGAKAGSGYCMSVQCHYTLGDGVGLEESIVFYNGHLYRVGSKTTNGVKIGWQEDLKQVNN